MKKILICAAASMILLSGCSLFRGGEGVIKVNNTIITRAEADKAIDKAIDKSVFKNFGGADNFIKNDDNVMYLIFKQKVSNELIIKALIDQEIEKRGIKVTDEDIKAETKAVIDKVGSKEELNKVLKSRGVSNNEFIEDLKSQIRIKKLVASIKKIKITDADAENFYKTNIKDFKHEEQVRASHILISADTLQMIREFKSKNKDISAEDLNRKVDERIASQKAKAEAILAEVKANPDNFEKIAQNKSEDTVSGERGGELGFFSKRDMVKEFSDAAFAMKPNTISQTLVRTPYGFHIIKVTDRAEAGTTPFVKVKEEIKFYLETKEQISILKNLTDGLMKTAKIEYIDTTFKPRATDLTKKVVKTENIN